MLLYLFSFLENHYHHGFAVFHYLSLRCIMGALTALFISLMIGPSVIRFLLRKQIGQIERSYGPESHLQKSGTPTMGGLFILFAIVSSILLWSDLTNKYIWLLIATIVSYGVIGFYDDYLKIRLKNSRGLPGRYKFLGQIIFAVILALVLYFTAPTTVETSLLIPFTKEWLIPLGWFFIPFASLVIVSTSNAVNLTDGLDGLATLPIVLVAVAFGIFAYVEGNSNIASYLLIPYINQVGNVAICCSAIIGAGLGFLWFNTYPAQVFMGDVGSLSLGATLGIIAVMVRQELILMLMGGVFVIETLSVILQVASFKLRGKRLFKMSPLHHHFELSGWPEPRIIVRFWVITFILVLIGLSSLKIR